MPRAPYEASVQKLCEDLTFVFHRLYEASLASFLHLKRDGRRNLGD
jgi:hypothetical protein